MDFYRPFDSEPLRLDINYLCSFFRREMSLAAERVLSARPPQEFSPHLDMRAIARN
jgi:hypothetical protein